MRVEQFGRKRGGGDSVESRTRMSSKSFSPWAVRSIEDADRFEGARPSTTDIAVQSAGRSGLRVSSIVLRGIKSLDAKRRALNSEFGRSTFAAE